MYDIYSNARNDSWRFTLGRSGKRKLFAIGLNPSTATKEKSDTTVAKVEEVARRNGYDGFVMLNLCPIRATDYNELPEKVDLDATESNVKKIVKLIASESSPIVWAAWGDSIEARKYLIHTATILFDQLREHRVAWQHFGALTAIGHPRHPSRLSYTWEFSSLDWVNYSRNLDELLTSYPKPLLTRAFRGALPGKPVTKGASENTQ